MYKLKKNGAYAEVIQTVQLSAYLSSGWELVPEEEKVEAHETVASPSDEDIVMETDAVAAPKRRGGRPRKQ